MRLYTYNREYLQLSFQTVSTLSFQVLDRLGLVDKPQFIWNCDECGKQFEHTPVRVVAEKGARNVVGRTSSNRTNITIMAVHV
jgi:hypothetical protein